MHRRRTPVTVTAVLAATAALAIAGCGFGAGPGTKDASVNVTTNFGSNVIGIHTEKHVPGAETDMSLLERHFKVKTSYGGKFVDAINGIRGKNARTNWFYYVNGLLASKGAAATNVHKGDHIWWDLQNWTVAQPKAVVGAYPEPFTNGIGGREAPTLLTCGPQDRKACETVGADLRKQGVKAGEQELGAENGNDSNGVLVGTWKELHGVIATLLVNAGPAHSGVFAQFVHNTTLELDNPLGSVVKTLRGSVGLIAAVQTGTQIAPVWFVTGTNSAGVTAAAKDFNAKVLHNHFAVAIDGHKVISLPVTGRS